MSARTEAANVKGTGDNASGIVEIVGGGLCLVGLPFLFVRALGGARTGAIVAVSLYAFGLLYHFSISAVAHLLKAPRGRRVMAVLDDAGSLLLVAVSYTPFCLAGSGGVLAWTMLGLLWGGASLAFLASRFLGEKARESATALYYLAFTLVLPLVPAFRTMLPATALPWLPVAGIVFCSGLFFRSRRTMPYNHAIWHCFTGLASVLVYFAVFATI